MSKPDIWMPLYIGDYLAATAHLDAQESGAYLHLLMHSWKNGSLPANPEALRRIARIREHAWSSAWETLKPFFNFSEDGSPHQKRLESIRSEWVVRKEGATEKARHAANIRWGKDAPSNAQAPPPKPTPARAPATTPEKSARAPADREDVAPLVAQIVIAHPRSRLRNWEPSDVPYTESVATLQAVDAEAERGKCSRSEAAMMILLFIWSTP